MLTQLDERKLIGVHPKLVIAIDRILNAMSILGFPMGVTDGVRTQSEQIALYKQGRTKKADGKWIITDKSKVVTNADGIIHPSNHQIKADGYGHAIDCAFLQDFNEDGEPDEPRSFTWDETRPWNLYGMLVKSQGLVWGGEFSTIHDRPHAELPML